MDLNNLNGTPPEDNNSFGSGMDSNSNLGPTSAGGQKIAPDPDDKLQSGSPAKTVEQLINNPSDSSIWEAIPIDSKIETEAGLADYLKSIGLISEQIPKSSPFLDIFQDGKPPMSPARRSVIYGMEKILSTSMKHRHAFSVCCYVYKKSANITNADLVDLISKATNEQYSESYLSREVRAGEVIIRHPEARKVRDREVLNCTLSLSEEVRKEIFKTGRVNGKVSIYTGNRNDIIAEIKALKSGKPPAESTPLSEIAAMYIEVIGATSKIIIMNDGDKVSDEHLIVFAAAPGLRPSRRRL